MGLRSQGREKSVGWCSDALGGRIGSACATWLRVREEVE